MRQGNQNNNKRMRGRNRKGPNPLTRSYESNGPDVKIRGTALHIAEKYGQLARDAQSSGDRVAAENYFQHAEHYYRIIAAAQAQMPYPPQQVYRNDDGAEDESEEHGFGQRPNPNPQQPQIQGQPQNYQNGEQPAYPSEAQPYSGNGQQPMPNTTGGGEQPQFGEAFDDGGEEEPQMHSGQPNGGGRNDQHQFRRRRRPYRGGGGGGGGRPDNREGNYNPGGGSGPGTMSGNDE
jgi:hypothetical protein